MRKLRLSSELIDLYSNDYLGLARSDALYREADQWLDHRGCQRTGASGSRLLSGNTQLHLEVETQLEKFYHADKALLFNSGYDANLGLLGSVLQRGDLVLLDDLVHASIREGVRSGLARAIKFRHNDLSNLDDLYNRNKPESGNCYVVTESVFSMDGDSPDLMALSAWCKQRKIRLILDEAHAVGLYGPNGSGKAVELGLDQQIFARVVTFGKAAGCHGAAILGSTQLIDYLINFAKPLIYSTSLPPHSVASIAVAHRAMQDDQLREDLYNLIHYFQKEVKANQLTGFFIDSESAIRSMVIRGNDRVKQASTFLARKGFDVRPIMSPTVPLGTERLRFCLHNYNTADQIRVVLNALKEFI